MKKIFYFFTLFILVFSLAGCSNQKEINFGEYEQKFIVSKDDLTTENVLTVGISKGYSPYLSVRKTNDIEEYYGAEPFLANYLAQTLGLELKLVDHSNLTLVSDLSSKTYDVALSNLIYNSSYVDQGYLPSKSYVKTKTLIVVSDKTIKEVDGKNIGVVEGSLQEKLASDLTTTVFSSKNSKSLCNALLSGEVEAILLNESEAEALLNRSEFKSFTVLDEKLESEYDGAVLYVTNEGLQDAINKALSLLDDEQFQEWNLLDFSNNVGFFGTMWKLVKRYAPKLGMGIVITLGLSFVTVLFGTVLGIIATLIRRNKYKPVKFVAASYVEVVRGIPLLLLLWFIYLAVPSSVPALISVGVALFINSGAYVAEIIRAGIGAVDQGQIEASRSLGMTNGQTMMKVVLPQAIRNILPALGNEFVTVIKETSLASVFFVGDLMTVKNQITSLTYLSLEPFVIVAIIYFVLTFSLSKLIGLLERKLNQ